MNAFLEKMFNYQYFGVILLCVIALLAVLFIVVFAIAIKDAKKAKKSKELTILDDDYGENEDKEDLKVAEDKKEEVAEIPLDDILNNDEVEENEADEVSLLDATLTNIESEIKLIDNDIKELDNDDSELQSLAMSFAQEYKKEREKAKEEPAEEIKEEKKEVKHIELPSFADIPTPQPIKVIDEQPIIDSSKHKKKPKSNRPLDNIVGEEYNLK